MSDSRGLLDSLGRFFAPAVILVAANLGFAQDGFTRVQELESGSAVRLDMSVREFSKEGGPKIYLAAAVHIGEARFYKDLQSFLDAKDVVLFEGVKPPGAGAAEHDAGEQSDDARAGATRRRIRFLAMAIERFRADHKTVPGTLNQLQEQSAGRIASLLKGSTKDAWGNDFDYWVQADNGGDVPRFDIVSHGSDGKPGGEGTAADIAFSAQKPLSKSERGDRSDGLQTKLAEATGLVFQLDSMNHDGPNWRNSDLSMDQVQARLDKSGADGGMLFRMLDGSSIFSRLGGFLLGMVGSTPEGQAMLRLMLIEMLGHADVLIQNAPGGMGKLMEVILEDRNQVVLSDLKRIIESEPDVKSIAIIYGAGHLPGIQQGIRALGYQPSGDTWFTAMRANAKEAGISDAQFKATREMVGRMVDAQVKKAR